MADETRISIGVLTRPFGLAGALRCELNADVVPLVAIPTRAWIGYTLSFVEEKQLIRCDRRPKDLVCYFAGVNTPEGAAALVDKGIWLPIESIGYDSPFKHPRINGYTVCDEAGRYLGEVARIFNTAAHPIWEICRGVDSNGGALEWLLPAVDQFIVAIDHAEQRVTVRTIPGMIDFDENVGGSMDKNVDKDTDRNGGGKE